MAFSHYLHIQPEEVAFSRQLCLPAAVSLAAALEQNALSQGTGRRRHQGQLDLGCLGWPQAVPLKVTGRADPARGVNTVGRRRQPWPGAE